MKTKLFIYFTFVLSAYVHADNSLIPSAVSSAENSIVQTRVHAGPALGTGYFIQKNTVVTVLHALGDIDRQSMYVENKLGRARVKRITHLSAVHDLAILEVTDHPAPPLRMENYNQLENVNYLLGYAHKMGFLEIIGQNPHFEGERIYFFADHKIVKSVLGGTSGSPILNSQGQVIGTMNFVSTGKFSGSTVTALTELASQPALPLKSQGELLEAEFERTIVLANQGHVQAQFGYGLMLQDESQTLQSEQNEKLFIQYSNEALKFFQRAAKQGYSPASMSVAQTYALQGNVKKAFQWAQKSANQGFSGAYAAVGHSFLLGSGTKRNVNRGIQWLKRAAELGDAVALEILEQESEQGNTQAQRALSSITSTSNRQSICERNFSP